MITSIFLRKQHSEVHIILSILKIRTLTPKEVEQFAKDTVGLVVCRTKFAVSTSSLIILPENRHKQYDSRTMTTMIIPVSTSQILIIISFVLFHCCKILNSLSYVKPSKKFSQVRK